MPRFRHFSTSPVVHCVFRCVCVQVCEKKEKGPMRDRLRISPMGEKICLVAAHLRDIETIADESGVVNGFL
jgi:hypothetical protein